MIPNLVCLVEDFSTKEMLAAVLPKIVSSDLNVTYIVFEGKQDLEKQIERKLSGWRRPNSVFLVLRDQDSGDCYSIKKELSVKIESAQKQDYTLIRIACRELESFYLGDLQAVEQGLGLTGLSPKQKNKRLRTPDTLNNAKEELRKITNKQYQPIAGSRSIAPYLNLDGKNLSHSFNVLLSGIKDLLPAQ